MRHNKNILQELSVKDEIRALKVLLSALIVIYLCSLTNYLKVSTTVITVSIVFAIMPTVSGARTYCAQRFVANILGAILTFCIGVIFNWNIYSLALICSLAVFIYYRFNLNKTKLSLMSFIAGSVVLFFYMSNPTNVLVRLLSILVGSLIAIVVNELFLPINQGLKVEKLILNFSKDALKIHEYIFSNINNLENLNIQSLASYNQSIKPNIVLLDKEAKINSLKNHLKSYKSKIDTLDKFGNVCRDCYEFLNTLDKNKYEFSNLSIEERLYIKEVLIHINDKYKCLLGAVLNSEDFKNISLLDIEYNKFNLNNTTSILLLGKLLEYRNSLIELEKSIPIISFNDDYVCAEDNHTSVEVF